MTLNSAARSRVDIAIPGNGNRLWASYRLPSDEAVAQWLSQVAQRPVQACTEILEGACAGLEIPQKGVLVPLTEAFPELGEPPVGFTSGVASALKRPVGPDGPVAALFPDRNSVFVHVSELMRRTYEARKKVHV